MKPLVDQLHEAIRLLGEADEWHVLGHYEGHPGAPDEARRAWEKADRALAALESRLRRIDARNGRGE